MTEKGHGKVTRRDFVRGALGSGGALALGACASPASTPVEWDRQADVVVVGYGGAGAAAAITAAEAGESVIVVEKAPEPGGNTAVSSGGCGYRATRRRSPSSWKSSSLGTIDEETAKVFADVWADWRSGSRSHGARFTVTEGSHRWAGIFPGADALNRRLSMDRDDEWTGVGRDLFAFLAEHRGAERQRRSAARYAGGKTDPGRFDGADIGRHGTKRSGDDSSTSRPPKRSSWLWADSKRTGK